MGQKNIKNLNLNSKQRKTKMTSKILSELRIDLILICAYHNLSCGAFNAKRISLWMRFYAESRLRLIGYQSRAAE